MSASGQASSFLSFASEDLSPKTSVTASESLSGAAVRPPALPAGGAAGGAAGGRLATPGAGAASGGAAGGRLATPGAGAASGGAGVGPASAGAGVRPGVRPGPGAEAGAEAASAGAGAGAGAASGASAGAGAGAGGSETSEAARIKFRACLMLKLATDFLRGLVFSRAGLFEAMRKEVHALKPRLAGLDPSGGAGAGARASASASVDVTTSVAYFGGTSFQQQSVGVDGFATDDEDDEGDDPHEAACPHTMPLSESKEACEQCQNWHQVLRKHCAGEWEPCWGNLDMKVSPSSYEQLLQLFVPRCKHAQLYFNPTDAPAIVFLSAMKNLKSFDDSWGTHVGRILKARRSALGSEPSFTHVIELCHALQEFARAVGRLPDHADAFARISLLASPTPPLSKAESDEGQEYYLATKWWKEMRAMIEWADLFPTEPSIRSVSLERFRDAFSNLYHNAHPDAEFGPGGPFFLAAEGIGRLCGRRSASDGDDKVYVFKRAYRHMAAFLGNIRSSQKEGGGFLLEKISVLEPLMALRFFRRDATDLDQRFKTEETCVITLRDVYKMQLNSRSDHSRKVKGIESDPRPITKRDFYFRFPLDDSSSSLRVSRLADKKGVITLNVCCDSSNPSSPKWFARNFRYAVNTRGVGVMEELKSKDGIPKAVTTDNWKGSVHPLWVTLKRLHSEKHMVSCGIVNDSIPLANTEFISTSAVFSTVKHSSSLYLSASK